MNPAVIDRINTGSNDESIELTVDLPASGEVTAIVHPHRKKTKTLQRIRGWNGSLRQHVDSEVALVSRDGMMAGSIRKGRIVYEIKPGDNGSHHLLEIDSEELPPDYHPIPVSKEQLDAAEQAAGRGGQPGSTQTARDDGSVIDVLVVYTETVKNANGGQSGIEASIDLAVALANQALANSSIHTEFRLVHTAQVTYTEAANSNTDLNRLQNPGDSFMDGVHALRNQYNADLVALIVENLGDACGIGYVMTPVSPDFEKFAFSVVQHSCISSYTFAHEVGHNIGSMHDRQEGGRGAFPYSFGHKEPGKFRTIMAYPCPPPNLCTRINHYSNPHVQYQGSWATGVDDNVDPAHSADNARGFNNALGTVARFRDSEIDTTAPDAPANLHFVD
ncbi:M12 family metallo-peptidase [Nitrospira sp. KM1]|uniref:M12 family metallo-peptidase n=1 Tax=Nitrospira sp. KM1 TaxID=1936990 RepID=UPI001565C4BE|nr:M12 family metallo-peptidase [Nitrospira sp. KM1]